MLNKDDLLTYYFSECILETWCHAHTTKTRVAHHTCFRYLQPNHQKQPPKGVSTKRCSENLQQIYRRPPMPKCNFNKVPLQSHFGMGVLL